jgi:cysteine synthase A
MSAPIIDSILDLIGNTPLVRVKCAESPGSASVFAKCEQLNPGGSVKDRICLSMLDAAEREGRIQRGSVIVEPTSGNTGIGLALVCAVRGYKLILTMPESMSLERRALLKAYGVEIVLTPAEQVMDGAIEAARDIAEKRGAFMPMQFENEHNPEAHYTRTAVEILEAMGPDKIDALVAAVGTGGTISGTGKRLKEHNASTRVIAIEPETSPVLSGGEPGPTKIQGIGAGFIPDNYKAQVVDEIRHVSDRDAYDMKRKLAREAGLLVGISAGANLHAAGVIARELGAGKNVVTVLCDTGERYFSLDEYFQ